MAGAGFSERLAYLQNGTSFEKLFDGNSMDAVDPDYRQKLVQLLRNGNVFCGEDKYGNFAYSLHKTPAGFEVVDDCIEIKMTEPGEGLFSTLEGKMYLSAQKSHKENGEHSILEKTNSAAIDR